MAGDLKLADLRAKVGRNCQVFCSFQATHFRLSFAMTFGSAQQCPSAIGDVNQSNAMIHVIDAAMNPK